MATSERPIKANQYSARENFGTEAAADTEAPAPARLKEPSMGAGAKGRAMTKPRVPGEVHGFVKNQTERIHAGIYRFRGEYRVDLRTFYLGENGRRHRTKRGISIPLTCLPDLEAAVAKLRQSAGGLAEEP